MALWCLVVLGASSVSVDSEYRVFWSIGEGRELVLAYVWSGGQCVCSGGGVEFSRAVWALSHSCLSLSKIE